MTYFLFITGCYQNYYDAQHIAHLLQKMGYVLGKEKDADLIVIISCSVRQKPIDRIFGKIKNWRLLPQKPAIIMTGCILPKDRKKFQEKVDLVTNVDEFEKDFNKINHCHSCPALKCHSCEGRNPVSYRSPISKRNTFRFEDDKSKSNNLILPNDLSSDTALVPIMYGCDNFCSYCAVPYTRGRERSRDEKEIISEIKKQLSRGKKKILLLGQNVNSYQGSDIRSQKSDIRSQKSDIGNLKSDVRTIPFASLLLKIDKIPGDFSFNFTSSNPHDFHESLIKTLPKLKKWERILQLPLQSGDDEILKKMNRKYSIRQYLDIIKNLKLKIKNLSVTTDIIVGFPGETEEQFKNTLKLGKKINFDKVFVAQYSPRPETLASRFLDDVPRAEKKRRWKKINSLFNQ